jgi:hypothetical protein
VPLETTYLTRMFQEVGLTAEQADRAREITARRLLRRLRVERHVGRGRFREAMLSDPLVSVNRILGVGGTGLPFYDEEKGRLSELAFTSALAEAGLDADVALAFAKVVVEAFEPEDFYQPVWLALGRTGDIDLEALRQLDWSPLRTEADSGRPPVDPGPPPRPGKRKAVVPPKKKKKKVTKPKAAKKKSKAKKAKKR